MAHAAAVKPAPGPRNCPNASLRQWTATLAPLGVGLLCFTVTELMHFLLVSDIGRRKERWLAEAISAIVVGLLVAKLIDVLHRQQETALARVQITAEINHHVRNALTAILASAEMTGDRQCIGVIAESVERIEWALREILSRKQPLSEEVRSRLMFYGRSKSGVPVPSKDGDEQHV